MKDKLLLELESARQTILSIQQVCFKYEEEFKDRFIKTGYAISEPFSFGSMFVGGADTFVLNIQFEDLTEKRLLFPLIDVFLWTLEREGIE